MNECDKPIFPLHTVIYTTVNEKFLYPGNVESIQNRASPPAFPVAEKAEKELNFIFVANTSISNLVALIFDNKNSGWCSLHNHLISQIMAAVLDPLTVPRNMTPPHTPAPRGRSFTFQPNNGIL